MDINEGVKIELISAFDLTDKEYKPISDKLKGILNKKFEIHTNIDRDLIAGLMVKLGSFVIDVSLRWKVQKASQDLVKER